jgi:hypothetical protein
VRRSAEQDWNVAATLRNPSAARFEQGSGCVGAFALDVTEPRSVGIRVKVMAPGSVATEFSARSLPRTFDGGGGPCADSIRKVVGAFEADAQGDR